MARNDPQMNLRVPVELKEKIEKAAFDNGRTITAEAVYRLEQSFDLPQIGKTNGSELHDFIESIVDESVSKFIYNMSLETSDGKLKIGGKIENKGNKKAP